MIAYRDIENTIHTLKFKEGVLVEDKITKNPANKRGTIISFRVSKKYMGDDAKLPIEKVEDWIDSLFYLDSEKLKAKGIKYVLNIYDDDMKLEKSRKFKPKPFYELLDKIIPNSIGKKDLSDICHFSGDVPFVEKTKTLTQNDDGTSSVDMVDVEKSIHMDISFRYITNPNIMGNAEYNTYCNYTNTTDNGSHLDAFDEAYCRYIQNKVNESMSDTQKNKIKILWEDCRTNLYCIINLSTNAQVGFVGNAKQKIQCLSLIPYMKELITNGLDNYFKSNSSSLDEIIKLVKLNAKARLEAAKSKATTQIEKLNSFKELVMSNYIRCNNTGKLFKEIFLVEGDSAGGGARNGSDPDTQAFYLFRGVVANALKCDLNKLMENKEWRELVTILKCGIGSKFDINKLYFDRINIMTDSDIDGYGISSGILLFFYIYMRPIIEQGKLYKVFSPLYRIDDKDHPFVVTKYQIVEIYHKKIIKNFKIKRKGDKDFMSKSEFYDFLNDTYDYRNNLIRAAKESGNIYKFFIEIVISNLVTLGVVRSFDDYDNIEKTFSDQKFIKTIMNNIQKEFKEVTVDSDGVFRGVINSKRVVIKVGNRFFKKTADLIPIYAKYGDKLIVKEKDTEREMSIGEFIDNCMKLVPRIITRFKGLGEFNGKQLKETTLDINNRYSVQYTVEDVEKELGIFEITHGNSKKNLADRKALMKSFKISRDDLDN